METDVRTRPGLNFIIWNQIDWIEVNVTVCKEKFIKQQMER